MLTSTEYKASSTRYSFNLALNLLKLSFIYVDFFGLEISKSFDKLTSSSKRHNAKDGDTWSGFSI